MSDDSLRLAREQLEQFQLEQQRRDAGLLLQTMTSAMEALQALGVEMSVLEAAIMENRRARAAEHAALIEADAAIAKAMRGIPEV